MNRKESVKGADFINVSILLAVALCIGVYLIITAFLISKDGTTFIRYAQKLSIEPLKIMQNEDQHPGFPWLILAAHRITDLLSEDTSVLRWIICGQSVALIFRLFAVVVLYFLAKRLVGASQSFWAVLILVILPKPAEYGSDALSDWPHLFFLLTGFLLLIIGARNKGWWLFGLAGIAAGAGYLVRPECAQLIVIGCLWLVVQMLKSKNTSDRVKTLSGLVVLLVGFSIIVGPYMKFKGAVFPKKSIVPPTTLHDSETNSTEAQPISQATRESRFAPLKVAGAFGRLVSNTGETLMWFFVPALLIGMLKSFRRCEWSEPKTFLVAAIILLNIPVMVWLYCGYGYMADRHTLPMLVIPILYVPAGLSEMARWLNGKYPGKNERFWFSVLVLAGICVCAPKLFMPIRLEKQGYRAAAEWLKTNTEPGDTVAVPDPRISFYAERKGMVYENVAIPENAEYIVQILEKGDNQTVLPGQYGKVVYEHPGGKKGEGNVIIYRKM
jgi:hypothetical protein